MTANKLLFPLIILCLINCGERKTRPSPFIENIKADDSLELTTYFSDCGEWGGHLEHIYLFSRNNNLWFTYKTDSIKCNGPKETQKSLIEISKELTSDQKRIVETYIDSLISFQKTHTEMTSNGCNLYYLKTNDTIIKAYHDDWNFFEKTIEKLIK